MTAGCRPMVAVEVCPPALVPVSVTVGLPLTEAGAVYKPLAETVPLDAVQIMPLFQARLTVA